MFRPDSALPAILRHLIHVTTIAPPFPVSCPLLLPSPLPTIPFSLLLVQKLPGFSRLRIQNNKPKPSLTHKDIIRLWAHSANVE